jgi:hypothetical protein
MLLIYFLIVSIQALNTLNRYQIEKIESFSQLSILDLPRVSASKRLSKVSSEMKEAQPGHCDPKLVCIPNPLFSQNDFYIAWPQCITIHRCGGCCAHNEICEAVLSENVTLNKVAIIYDDRIEENTITVVNHTKCDCKCKWESDYSCKLINKNYVRDPYSCNCICPQVKVCSPLHEFDHESCNCICNKEKYDNLMKNCRIRGYSWNEILCRCETNRPVPRQNNN